MKIHTTNYFNTFIEVSDDCPVSQGEIPPTKADRSIANIQFEMISQNPYKFTSDEILFHCHATKKGLAESGLNHEKELFFSKGQACLRCSPLTKRYGWGVHHDEDGKVALYSKGSEEYEKLVNDKTLKIVKAMRSKKS